MFRSFCVCGKGDISREEAEDELLADATDVFWKGDKDAEAAVKTLVEKNRSLGETILNAIKSTVDKLNTLGKNAMNALKGELRGKWLEELGILEKAQEMWTNALMDPEVDEFEEAVDHGDEIKFMYKGKNEEGIERYSISKKSKQISLNKRKSDTREKINSELRGENIIFEVNGNKYNAQIGRAFTSKNLYGDNQTTSVAAFDKKISLMYEGDTTQLLKDEKYMHSSKDVKNKHGKIACSGIILKKI